MIFDGLFVYGLIKDIISLKFFELEDEEEEDEVEYDEDEGRE